MKITGFQKTESFAPRNKKETALITALLSIKTPQDMVHFLRDLMTLPEITELSNRLEMARLLLEGHSYESIAKKIGVSTTTVTRVAHWLYNGTGGYWKVLNKK